VTIVTLDVAWLERDRYATLTRLAILGIVLAAVFATVGLPPIGLHSPLHYLGVMAPSCGLTRGTVALARGSLGDAIRFNPASPLVVLAGAALLARGVVGAVTGRWLDVRAHIERLGWMLLTVLGAVLTVNQQLHADLLR